ncbi:MAG TPA: hypothetical protein DCE23_01115, partial [Firmicutes bacterium]|nr:hypothetical protein [Bacillota bacterium]
TSSVTAENEYIKLTAQDFKNGEANIQLAKNSTLAGRTLEIKQRKSYVGTDTSTEKQYNIECTINASGLSANK